MKRWLGLGVFFAVSLAFLSSGVFAASCVDGQTLFRMFSSSNSHGAEWNFTAVPYSFEICYDSLYGESYTGANPHNCIDGNGDGVPENAVIRLAKNNGYPLNNAHAQWPYGINSAYSYVCYGDLVCRTTIYSCNLPGEKEIVTLSDSYQGAGTNSHLGQPGTYPTKVCCSSAAAGGSGTCDNDGICEVGEDQLCGDCQQSGDITSVEWRKSGQRITEAYIDQTVTLVAQTNLGSGTVNFDAWDDDNANGRKDSGDDNIGTFTGSINNGLATANLLLTQQLIDSADDGTDCENGGLEFFFNASIPGSSRISYKLNVHCEAAPPEPPKANITAPEHKGVYFQNTRVWFTQDPGTDDTSHLEFEWTIEEDDFTSNLETFEYTFATTGQKTVTLKVSDINTGLYDEDQVGIVVLASPGIMAYVNEPFHLELVPQVSGPNNNPRLVVKYNASDSFVVNSFGSGCPTVNCVAGYCPDRTENVPVGCLLSDLPIITPDKGFTTESNFTWNFEDGDFDAGSGGDYVSGSKLFGDNFAGRRIIIFKYEFANSFFSLTKETERTFDLGQCVDGGNSWLPLNDNGKAGIPQDTQTVNRACVGVDGQARTADDCCRDDFVCADDGTGVVRCLGEDTEIELCQDYQNQNDCVNDAANILDEDLPGWNEEPECGSYYNGDIVECSCSWRTDNEQCYFNKTYTGSGTGHSDDDDDSCIYTYEMGECIDGYRDVEVTAEYSGIGNPNDVLCVNESIVVLCGSPSVDLGFFDFNQFIVAGIIVVMIYFLMRQKEE